MDIIGLIRWLSEDKTSFAIFDGDGIGSSGDEHRKMENVIISDQFSGFIAEARERLSEKVLENLTGYLHQK